MFNPATLLPAVILWIKKMLFTTKICNVCELIKGNQNECVSVQKLMVGRGTRTLSLWIAGPLLVLISCNKPVVRKILKIKFSGYVNTS